MKVALIDRTGLKTLPVAATLHRHGHHLVLVSGREHPPIAPHPIPIRCEHHHIGLDDTAQLVTAFQDCAAVVVCTGALPAGLNSRAIEATELETVREACRRAGVPQLTHLRFDRALCSTTHITHPAPVNPLAPRHSTLPPV